MNTKKNNLKKNKEKIDFFSSLPHEQSEINPKNCWKIFRANITTTKLEMANVNVRKNVGLDDQQPSSCGENLEKVQRLEAILNFQEHGKPHSMGVSLNNLHDIVQVA